MSGETKPQPTDKLRWVEVSDSDDCCPVLRHPYEWVASEFVLQQLWTDGEWRDIEIEYNRN